MHNYELLIASPDKKPATEEMCELLGRGMSSNARRHFIHDAYNDNHTGLRLSQLGKPAIIQACGLPAVVEALKARGVFDALGVSPADNEFDDRMEQLFLTGDYVEELVLFNLRRAGYEIIWPEPDGTQLECEYNGVKGHADALVYHPDEGHWLLEIKSANDRRFYSMSRKSGHIPPEYLTQLACYRHSLLDTYPDVSVAFIITNKNNNHQAVIYPEQSELQSALDRADTILPHLRYLEETGDLLYLFTKFLPPDGEPEVYKGRETGMLRMPQSMAYFPLRELFYRVKYAKNSYGKMTEYVSLDGYTDITEYEDFVARFPNEEQQGQQADW